MSKTEDWIKEQITFGKLKTVSKDDAKKRMDICKECERFANLKPLGYCKECGCYMPFKTRLLGSECPIGKW